MHQELQQYQENRMQFSSQLTFMLTCLGFSAGFGSVWRFPYLVFKNGGGAFLIPYFILLFMFAIPLFYLEVALGQTKGIGLAHILQLEKPKFRGFGYVGIVIVFYVSTYYNLIMAYALKFLWDSFKFPLPWAEGAHISVSGFSKDYFYHDMLHISGDISQVSQIQWSLFIAYVISQILVYICIKEGVQTSGKIAIFTATSPYLILLILFIRGLYLEGASEGIKYLFTPDFVKLFDPMVWVDAANQVIFQMSVGQAVLVLYGSYRQKTDNIAKFSIGIPLLTALCGMLASLVVFSYIGHISHKTGTNISDLPLAGPDLAFVLYPAILAQMPLSNLWSILFFSVMVLLGIDTQFGFMDGIAGTLEDAYFGKFSLCGYVLTIPQVRLMICSIVSLTGLIYCTDIGFYLLGFVDKFATEVSFMLNILFELTYFCSSQRFEILKKDLSDNENPIPYLFEIKLTKICPILVYGLLLFSSYKQVMATFDYNICFAVIGWVISLSPFFLAGITYFTTSHQPEPKPMEIQLIESEKLE